MQERYLIHAYGDQGFVSEDDPRTLNYKTGLTTRLNPVYEFDKGRLVKTEWFAPDDQDEYTVHVLTVENEYFDNADGSVNRRITTRKWIVEDGSFGAFTKVTKKPYSPQLAKREGVRRRTNIVNELRDQTTLFGVQNQFLKMYRDLDLDIRAYVEEDDLSLINLIGVYKQDQPDGAWLETIVPGTTFTLRQAIMGALNYG